MGGCLVNIVMSHAESATMMDSVIISTAAVWMDVIQATMESIVQKVFSEIWFHPYTLCRRWQFSRIHTTHAGGLRDTLSSLWHVYNAYNVVSDNMKQSLSHNLSPNIIKLILRPCHTTTCCFSVFRRVKNSSNTSMCVEYVLRTFFTSLKDA